MPHEPNVSMGSGGGGKKKEIVVHIRSADDLPPRYTPNVRRRTGTHMLVDAVYYEYCR